MLEPKKWIGRSPDASCWSRRSKMKRMVSYFGKYIRHCREHGEAMITLLKGSVIAASFITRKDR